MATSPPTPTNLHQPTSRKRPSSGPPSQSAITPGYSSSQAAKRPKHQHPLRQTSFPSSEAQTPVYTPTGPRSETGSATASLVSGFSCTTGGKRSRGRPKKRKSQPHDIQTGHNATGGDRHDDDGGSAIVEQENNNNNHNNHNPKPNSRNRRGGTKSVISGAGAGGPTDDVAGAADDDDDNPADPNSDEARRFQVELAQEKERVAQLQEALTPEQMQRYTSFIRTKLKGGTLKRIVNQTVSQSVTANPLSAVQWVGKVYVGEIVELAREVQEEWALGWEVAKREDGENRARDKAREKAAEGEGEEKKNKIPIKTITPTRPAVKATEDLYAGANPHRGGLLPDHLREAVRRYKANGEGGGVGFGGFSFGNLATKGEAVPRLGMGSASGRRLFR